MEEIRVERKKKIYSVSIEDYEDHVDSYDGICLACGDWTSGGVEPDARGYECESCGENRVYGAEEALLIGRIDVVEE